MTSKAEISCQTDKEKLDERVRKNIRETIKYERNKRNLTQAELGKKINIQGKQISNYEKGITTPPMYVLLDLCNFFGCELGYLFGDPNYSDGTTLKTAVSKATGLNRDSLDAFEKVIAEYPNDSSVYFGHESNRIRSIFNALLTSHCFPKLVEILTDLDSASRYNESVWNALVDQYDEKTLNEALEIYKNDDSIENITSKKRKKKIQEIISEIDNAVDKMYENSSGRIPLERYRLSKAFDALIDELYPETNTIIQPEKRIVNMRNYHPHIPEEYK